MRSLLDAPVLARLPALATTGAGGVPFAEPRAAVAHVWRSYELPFCPRPAYAPATGYVSFFTLALYVCGLLMIPAPPPLAITRRSLAVEVHPGEAS